MRRSRRPRLLVEPLEERLTPSITIQFDYSHDTHGFFNNATAKALLEQAGATLGARLTDTLAAITPGGNNSWSAQFIDPADGSLASVDNLNVPASTLIVFVGGLPFNGLTVAGQPLSSNETGFAGSGGFSVRGTTEFSDIVTARGQAGALGLPANQTDYAPWGGFILFDSGANWFFNQEIAGISREQTDFLSVAEHELGHVLGFGTSAAWENLVSGQAFTGPASKREFGSLVPTDGPAPSAGHWADDVFDRGKATAMDPILTEGTRATFTPLDFAGLDDMGWEVSNEPPAPANDTLPSIAFSSSAITIPASQLLANDQPGPSAEREQSLQITAVDNAQLGSVSLSGTSVLFTPTPGVSGQASFSYTVQDNGPDPKTATATVSFTINPPAPPLTSPDTATVGQGSSSNPIAVLANDQDASNSGLTVDAVGPAGHGSTQISSDGKQVLYTPAPGFSGSDSFSYTARNMAGTTMGQVTITVTPAPAPAVGTDRPAAAVPDTATPTTSGSSDVSSAPPPSLTITMPKVLTARAGVVLLGKLFIKASNVPKVTVRITSPRGQFLIKGGGLKIAGNRSRTLTLIGTPAKVNAALKALKLMLGTGHGQAKLHVTTVGGGPSRKGTITVRF